MSHLKSHIGHKKFHVDDVVFIGRTLGEYQAMFDLDLSHLQNKRILDCPGGACSFTTEMRAKGYAVTAADILYNLPPEELTEKGQQDMETVLAKLDGLEDLFTWDFYGDVAALAKNRRAAFSVFANDYQTHWQKSRYIHAALPTLPFEDNQFDVTLSAHFLFLYDDRFDYDFHRQAILELIRVTAKEVRIFPLLGLDIQKSPFVERIIQDLSSDSLSLEVVSIPFEFQKGGNCMLKIIVNSEW